MVHEQVRDLQQLNRNMDRDMDMGMYTMITRVKY